MIKFHFLKHLKKKIKFLFSKDLKSQKPGSSNGGSECGPCDLNENATENVISNVVLKEFDPDNKSLSSSDTSFDVASDVTRVNVERIFKVCGSAPPTPSIIKKDPQKLKKDPHPYLKENVNR
jgi:hypothetical protein